MSTIKKRLVQFSNCYREQIVPVTLTAYKALMTQFQFPLPSNDDVAELLQQRSRGVDMGSRTSWYKRRRKGAVHGSSLLHCIL